MSSSQKTLIDLFKQPAAKRLKTLSSSPAPAAKLMVQCASLSSSSSSEEHIRDQDSAALIKSATILTSEEKSRIEFNKALARVKRNLKLCSEKISKCSPAGLFVIL